MLTFIFVIVHLRFFLKNYLSLMSLRRDVFQAIADPNRRAILGMLSHSQLNLNQVADRFEISRPAVSQHMKILAECGLVVIHKKGREHYCEAKLAGLSEISAWIDQYKQF